MEKDGVRFVGINFDLEVLPQVLRHLWEMEIQSVIVEGGTHTLEKFIDSGLWDEARVFVGRPEFGGGILAPEFKGELVGEESIDGDRLWVYRSLSA